LHDTATVFVHSNLNAVVHAGIEDELSVKTVVVAALPVHLQCLHEQLH
jgi:hypothetical protein